MRKASPLAIVATALLLGALGAAAQTHRPQNFVNPSPRVLPGVPQHVFVPGFGLQPVFVERFPVFGLGFDAHHFQVLNRGFGFHGGFVGQRFFGQGFFGGFAPGFFPGFFPAVSSSSSVVVLPQTVPVQVPVPVIVRDDRWDRDPVVVTTGLPPDWDRVQFVRPSYPVERAPLPQLTLLVLKDGTIYAVTDYWLEEGRVFYVTSTGKQKSIAVRDLDWEMTSQLNAERGVEFVLRSVR